MPEKILLGFEVKTGKPVSIPLHHLAIFGMTQLSGKTTALEALISRSGLRAVAFKTKRGEAGFHAYNEIPLYYKPRADWQYVEGLVNVALGEKVKYEAGMRSAIMKACEGTKDLKQVQQKAGDLAAHTKSGFMRSVFERLVAYLDIVIPELEKYTFTDKIILANGVNVMDLTGMRAETQQLIVGSTIDYAFLTLENIVIIIPEAWEMMPELRMTPVKLVAEQFIRKGASVGNYLWIDSQDIGGVSKVPLRQCDNWIMGRMREAHEVERILRQLLGVKIPKEEIQTLPLGHFFAVLGDKVKKVYVLPAGVPEGVGQNVAIGVMSPETVRDKYLKKVEVETDMKDLEEMRAQWAKTQSVVDAIVKVWNEKEKAIDEKQNALGRELMNVQKKLGDIAGSLSEITLPVRVEPSGKEIINLQEKELVVNIGHSENIVQMTTDDLFGRIMLCVLKDLPREGFDEMQLQGAMRERGWHMERIMLALNMGKLIKAGRLLKDGQKQPYRYRLPSKITVNVQEPEKG